MKTQIIEFAQGSKEWHVHRAKHLNASDCAAVLGLSSYKTRSQLLKEKATGFAEEVDSATQHRFSKGHEYESTARPWAEEIIGSELYPVVLAGDYEGLPLSASLDGLDIASEYSFEHKTGRADLLASLDQGVIPSEYHPQMEMGLMLSGASKCLFMASSGNKDAMRFAWYLPNPELRQRIIAAWKQFKQDLDSYVPAEVATPVVAQAVAGLPIVFDMRVEGKLVSCNIEAYKPAALAYIREINTELTTDQCFADADLNAKFCRNSAEKLKLAIEQALGQMGDINTAINSVREIASAFDAKGLMLEKLVKAEKENRRTAIVNDAATEFRTHITGLNTRLGRVSMPSVLADFSGVVKGLKSIDSMRDKVATELARAKIEANSIADRIQANLETKGLHGYAFLFADLATICLKPTEDFQNTVTARITAHEAAEAAKVEATRARIQAEEQAKAERNARELVAREQAAEAKRLADIAAFEKLEADEIARLARVNTQMVVEVTAPVAAPAPVATVIPFVAPRPTAAPATPPTLKLGDICARLAPITVTGAGLSQLGFEPAAIDRASRLYHDHDFALMCAAMVKHIEQVQAQQAA